MSVFASLGLFAAGLALSAFFSGAETGFYRVQRLRLVLDGMSGNWLASGLLALANRPSLYVATTLIGNNVANYMTSLAIVLSVNSFSLSSALANPKSITLATGLPSYRVTSTLEGLRSLCMMPF